MIAAWGAGGLTVDALLGDIMAEPSHESKMELGPVDRVAPLH